MAAGLLPPPGTRYGPCREADCGHHDCAATRRVAAALCTLCSKPIGFDTRYYNERDRPTDAWSYVHADCREAVSSPEGDAVL